MRLTESPKIVNAFPSHFHKAETLVNFQQTLRNVKEIEVLEIPNVEEEIRIDYSISELNTIHFDFIVALEGELNKVILFILPTNTFFHQRYRN